MPLMTPPDLKICNSLLMHNDLRASGVSAAFDPYEIGANSDEKKDDSSGPVHRCVISVLRGFYKSENREKKLRDPVAKSAAQ